MDLTYDWRPVIGYLVLMARVDTKLCEIGEIREPNGHRLDRERYNNPKIRGIGKEHTPKNTEGCGEEF